MLHAMFISYRAHYIPVPVDISEAVLQPDVNEVDGVVVHASQVQVPDEQLGYNLVKGTLCVLEEEVGWFLQTEC